LYESSPPQNGQANQLSASFFSVGTRDQLDRGTQLSPDFRDRVQRNTISSHQPSRPLENPLATSASNALSNGLRDQSDAAQSYFSRTNDNLRDGDGMGEIENGPPGHTIFGTSSAANFMKQIQLTVDAKISSKHRIPVRRPVAHHSLSSLDSTPYSAESKAPPEYVLRPRKTADQLLNTYWKQVHNLYPFIHQ
jgi:hypothetical protein